MKRFLHIGFNFKGEPKMDELVPTFNQAGDWLRYAPNCWIVWTSRDTQVWYRRLKPLLGEADNMLICKLDITERQGWLPQSTWEWINKNRT